VVFGTLLVENEDADAPVVFVLSNISAVTGTLTYCGSDTVADNVTLDGQYYKNVKLMLVDGTNDVRAAGTFWGNLSITGEAGDDTVLFHSVSTDLGDPMAPPFITASVAGTLTVALGNGTNEATFQEGASFAKGIKLTAGTGTDTVNMDKLYSGKDVSLSLGNGANVVSANPGTNQSNFVAGLFQYKGGVDADTLNISDLIADKIAVVLGNGANGVSGTARVLGKSASFTSGSGVDVFQFGIESAGAALSVNMGAGDDQFTFGGGALGSAKLDGGAGADTLTALGPLPAKRTVKFETVV
jgi:hypothetical protein